MYVVLLGQTVWTEHS